VNIPSRYGDPGASVAPGGGLFPEIGVEIMTTALYRYDMTIATDIAFVCTATANLDDDAAIDTWTIDNNGSLTNTINDVDL
ncbi:MAG: hypothetical protein V3T75_00890, partial [candidate division Zixibacteria bacterium]